MREPVPPRPMTGPPDPMAQPDDDVDWLREFPTLPQTTSSPGAYTRTFRPVHRPGPSYTLTEAP